MVSRHLALGCVFAAVFLPAAAAEAADRAAIEALITKHAKANGVPVSLVHRVVRRESNYNPRAYHRDNLGLMQIRHGTARGRAARRRHEPQLRGTLSGKRLPCRGR
jgi:soluble lytic murein transglycosylase-like protein